MKNKKQIITWQTPAAILLLFLGIAGFLWALLPPSKDTVVLELQEIRVPLDDGTYAMLQQPYQMQVAAPKSAKLGKQFDYTFKLKLSEQPINITAQDVDIYDYYQVNIELRPDFLNTTINPPGSMTTAMLEGQEPAMIWKMDPIGNDAIEGVFWVYVAFVPLVDEVEPSSSALLARNVNIPVQTILGLTTRWVAIIATALTVAAIFLGIPQLPFFKGEGFQKQRAFKSEGLQKEK